MKELIKLPNDYKTTKLVSSSFDYDLTYDIEVENSHYYPLKNGLISHNTLSLMFRDTILSYGIEPAFGIYFWKRTRISGKYEYYFTVPKVVRDVFAKAGYPIPMETDSIKDTWDGSKGKPIADFIDENKAKIGINFASSTEVKPLDKLDLMAKVMKNIDSSISTTYMLPLGSDWKDTYEFIMEAYRRGVKSIAAFPDKKMYGIVSFIPFKELAISLRKEKVHIHEQNFSEEEHKELQTLNLDTEREDLDGIVERDAPKRPVDLPCEIHHVSVEGKKWTVMVGLLNGRPYEVFGGLSENVHIPKKIESGHVKKRKCEKPNAKGRLTCYDLYCGEEDDPLIIKDITVTFDNPEYALVTRFISMALRHGTPLKYIIEQLNRSHDSTIVSFNNVMSRILKKYLRDDQTGEIVGDASCLSGNCE